MHLCPPRGTAWLGLAAIFAGGGVFADLIFMENGVVDGTVIEENETSVKIKSNLGTVEIPRSSIKSIERGKSWIDVYRQKWMAVDHEDPEARVELALWAKKRRLDKEAELEFEQILEIDPDNATARRNLGYEKLAGRWVQSEEAKLARGMVEYQGRWMTPQEKQRLLAVKVRLATKQKVEELFNRMRKAEPYERDALQQTLYGVRTPYSAHYVVKYIRDRNPALREIATTTLGKLKDKSVVSQLVEVAMGDPESAVRRQAGKALGAIGDLSGTLRLAPYLAHSRKLARIRAARALEEMGDVRAVPYLIEGLFVKIRIVSELDPFHRPDRGNSTTTNTAGGLSTRTTSPGLTKTTTGGTSLNLGGEPVQYTYEENKAALEALQKLTGQDFSYSKSQWRDWWEASKDDLLAKHNRK